jgi:hypothetical protein
MSGSLVITGSLRAGVGSDPAIDTTVGTLSNGSVTSVDWTNKQLNDSSPVTSVDWETRRLYNSAGTYRVDWEGAGLYDSTSQLSLDWDSRVLTDSNGINVFNWDTKRFRYSNNNSLLTFETPGTAAMFVSASFCVSASGMLNATGSISITGFPGENDWYTIKLRSKNAAASSSIEVSKYITISHGAGGATEFKGDIVNFYPVQQTRIFDNASNSSAFIIEPATSIVSTLTVAGITRLTNNVHVTGSLSISGSGASVVILPKVSQSLNFVDDTAAAAAGVPLGGLYRNGSFIMIRVS